MKKVLLILLLIVSTFGLTGCVSSSIYSDAAHLRRIARRVEKRYMGKDSEYTSFELYKIYNENDEFKYVLVEFEPYGFIYVKINEDELMYGPSMYTNYDRKCWFKQNLISNPNNDKIIQFEFYKETVRETFSHNRDVLMYELDESGFPIIYNRSHYKVADVLDEKLYMIEEEGRVVPCIKKNGGFQNLMSVKDSLYSIEDLKKECYESYILFAYLRILDL